MRTLTVGLLHVCLLASVVERVGAAEEDDFRPLFDGKTLDGWVQRGGEAKYEVADGCVVGTTKTGTPNSFLCTDRDYGDFVLLVDFKVDDGMNSGVQFRSQCFDEEKTLENIKTNSGKPKTIPAGRVHGYQCEIDPSDRAFSGGVYDEARRGVFLADLKGKPEARKAFKHDDWNTFRIECKGESIKTWINGVPAADFTDAMTPKGFIALQVHGTKKEETMHVRWRNIKIKEL